MITSAPAKNKPQRRPLFTRKTKYRWHVWVWVTPKKGKWSATCWEASSIKKANKLRSEIRLPATYCVLVKEVTCCYPRVVILSTPKKKASAGKLGTFT